MRTRQPTRPAEVHPDLNLAIRSYAVTSSHLRAGQLWRRHRPAGAADRQHVRPADACRATEQLFQVYDWDWACNPPDGYRGALISDYPVTLLEMTTTPGGPSASAPAIRRIDAAGYRALVLYASERRLMHHLRAA